MWLFCGYFMYMSWYISFCFNMLELDSLLLEMERLMTETWTNLAGLYHLTLFSFPKTLHYAPYQSSYHTLWPHLWLSCLLAPFQPHMAPWFFSDTAGCTTSGSSYFSFCLKNSKYPHFPPYFQTVSPCNIFREAFCDPSIENYKYSWSLVSFIFFP